MSSLSLQKHYTIAYPVEQVYAAWISSNTVIAPATRMRIAPEVGGHYELYMDGDGFSGYNKGVFRALEPNKLVRYTWEWNDDGEVTEIEVHFNANGQHTNLTLAHSGFKSEMSLRNHDAGWDAYIEGLTAHLAAAS